MVKPLVAATLCMAIVACAAGGRKPTMAPPSSAESAGAAAPAEAGGAPASPMVESAETAELERLYVQMEKLRAELGQPEPVYVTPPGPATPMSSVPQSTDATCKPAKTEQCTSSCTLSDSICRNAGRICALANDIGDDWSAAKCARAKQTCQAANETCCGCR